MENKLKVSKAIIILIESTIAKSLMIMSMHSTKPDFITTTMDTHTHTDYPTSLKTYSSREVKNYSKPQNLL